MIEGSIHFNKLLMLSLTDKELLSHDYKQDTTMRLTDHALNLRTVPPLCYVLRVSASSKKLGFLEDGAC